MNFTYPYRGTYSTDYRGGRGSAVERLLCKEDAKGSIPLHSTRSELLVRLQYDYPIKDGQ